MLGSTRVSKPGLIIFYGECWIFFLNELIWAHMNSLELLWAHLNSHELPWTPLNSPELPWTPLNSPEFTWNPLNSPEFTWNSLNSPEIPWSHLNIIEFAWSFWFFFYIYLKKMKSKTICMNFSTLLLGWKAWVANKYVHNIWEKHASWT